MKRQVQYIRHFSILVLTIIIFALGIFIGSDIEQLRVQNLYTQLQEQDIEYQQIVTEGRYIDYLVSKAQGSNSCPQITGAYFTSIENLETSRLKLESYINSAQSQEEEYFRLRDHYANMQINYWLLAKQIDTLCQGNFSTILYFYSEDEEICPACEDQGIHLTYVKQRLQDDVLIFSFNVENDGPIDLLKQNFEVDSRELPVVVINEEVFGFLENEEIFDELEQ